MAGIQLAPRIVLVLGCVSANLNDDLHTVQHGCHRVLEHCDGGILVHYTVLMESMTNLTQWWDQDKVTGARNASFCQPRDVTGQSVDAHQI